jgi:hypothetical protein
MSVYRTCLTPMAATEEGLDLKEETGLDTIDVKIYDQYEIGRGKTKIAYKVCSLLFAEWGSDLFQIEAPGGQLYAGKTFLREQGKDGDVTSIENIKWLQQEMERAYTARHIVEIFQNLIVEKDVSAHS